MAEGSMSVFVWESLEGLTSFWHNGGGLVIVARSLDHAREQWGKDVKWRVYEGGKYKSEADGPLPDADAVFPIAGAAEPQVFLFPDAGCC